VVAVGNATLIGRIAVLASGMDSLDTPLAREILDFVKLITSFALLSGGIFFGSCMWLGYDVISSFIDLIGVIAANVPEGVLVSFTTILAITAKRMAARNCLIRQLHAVESLGSCSVICSDKTGTLTQNKMTTSHFWLPSEGIVDSYKKLDVRDDEAQTLIRAATLCSRAEFEVGQNRIPIGDRSVTA